MMKDLDEAEQAVRCVFADEFPTSDFDHWNQNLDDRAAETIIKTVGRASRINVAKFIDDLR